VFSNAVTYAPSANAIKDAAFVEGASVTAYAPSANFGIFLSQTAHRELLCSRSDSLHSITLLISIHRIELSVMPQQWAVTPINFAFWNWYNHGYTEIINYSTICKQCRD
jgi:hypothetical protein